MENEEGEENDLKKNDKKKQFLKSFSKFLNNGPLTFNEYSKCNYRLIDYIDDKSHSLQNYLINEQESNFGLSYATKKTLSSKGYNFSSKKNKKEESQKLLAESAKLPNPNVVDPESEEFVFENFKNIDLSKSTLCNSCLRWKFERSHHCRSCGKCVLKMDHHCPWLANCIGFRNYKYFCLMHFYGTIGCLFVAFSFWEVIFNQQIFDNAHVLLFSFYNFVYIANLGLMAFLFWLLFSNIKLVFNGQTIIEQSDRERFPSSKSVNIYDLGTYRNFKTVFGENCLFWLFPIYANYNGLGIIFETNENKS